MRLRGVLSITACGQLVINWVSSSSMICMGHIHTQSQRMARHPKLKLHVNSGSLKGFASFSGSKVTISDFELINSKSEPEPECQEAVSADAQLIALDFKGHNYD